MRPVRNKRQNRLNIDVSWLLLRFDTGDERELLFLGLACELLSVSIMNNQASLTWMGGAYQGGGSSLRWHSTANAGRLPAARDERRGFGNTSPTSLLTKFQAMFEANRDLKSLCEDLRDANGELEAFAASVSHDFRSPLACILGFTQLLLTFHAGKMEEEAVDFLKQIFEQASRMETLAGDLLRLSKAGSAAICRTEVDLSGLAREIAAGLIQAEPGRRADFDIENNLKAEADHGLMRIALENLLGNAWKFTAKTGRTKISVSKRIYMNNIYFVVNDNGVGFDAKQAEQLFRPFHRLHSEADFPGTGIGLVTVKRIISRHGGDIVASSSPWGGASFYFTIPKG